MRVLVDSSTLAKPLSGENEAQPAVVNRASVVMPATISRVGESRAVIVLYLYLWPWPDVGFGCAGGVAVAGGGEGGEAGGAATDGAEAAGVSGAACCASLAYARQPPMRATSSLASFHGTRLSSPNAR